MTQDAGAGRAHAGVATDLPLTWEPSLAFVKYAIAAILAASAVYLVALAIVAPEQSWRPAAVIGLMLMTSLAGRLRARGRMALAVASLAIGVWLFITITAVFLGGISGTTLIIYPLVILLVGGSSAPRSTGVAVLTVLATGVRDCRCLACCRCRHTALALRWLPHAGVFLISPALIVRWCGRIANGSRWSAQCDLVHRTAEIQRAKPTSTARRWSRTWAAGSTTSVADDVPVGRDVPHLRGSSWNDGQQRGLPVARPSRRP
jgi:hypothetical protein